MRVEFIGKWQSLDLNIRKGKTYSFNEKNGMSAVIDMEDEGYFNDLIIKYPHMYQFAEDKPTEVDNIISRKLTEEKENTLETFMKEIIAEEKEKRKKVEYPKKFLLFSKPELLEYAKEKFNKEIDPNLSKYEIRVIIQEEMDSFYNSSTGI